MRRLLAAILFVGGIASFLWWGLTAPTWTDSVRQAVGIILPPAALGVCFLGLFWKMARWSVTPVPFPITLTTGQQLALGWIKPAWLRAPASKSAAALRTLFDALLFLPLFRNSRARMLARSERLIFQPAWSLWFLTVVFHYSLALVCLRHLRFLFDSVPAWLKRIMELDGWLQLGVPRLWWSGFLLCLALLCLLGRRALNPPMRKISLFSDHIALLFLLAIASTGLCLRYVARGDMLAISAYVHNIPGLQGVGLSDVPPLFLLHLGLACGLLMYLPFSKLTHGLGLFFTPTLNARSDTRRVSPSRKQRTPRVFSDNAPYANRFHRELDMPHSSSKMPATSGGDN